MGFHNLTGADWGGKFVGISKKTCMNAYRSFQQDDPILQCFIDLGNGPIQTSLSTRSATCMAKTRLPSLKMYLFQTKNAEGEMLPPTRAALLPHILRANFVSTRDKSYVTPRPVLPLIEDSGWEKKGDDFVPVRCLKPPAPLAVLELRKCSCQVRCGGRCTC